MFGLMQHWPLTVDKILDHAQNWHADREIVSRAIDRTIARSSYGQVHERAKRLSNALLDLGVEPGDRVATLCWNNGRHLEAWYGIMGIGAVCHTLNPRLFVEQLCYIINHAEDKVVLIDADCSALIERNLTKLKVVPEFVIMTDRSGMANITLPNAHCYEDLIGQYSAECLWGGFDENSAAGLCYTSGTTGNPKGVLYSHRSNFLHTLVTMGADVLALKATDVVMPMVPMFHSNAWGLPFSAPATGAKLVLPGQQLDGASIHELMEAEGVTFAGAVPTVWQALLTHLQDTGGRLSTLKRAVVGGAAVPKDIVRRFRDDHGVAVIHGWGMTETSPLGTLAIPNASIAEMDAEAQMGFTCKQGRVPIGVEMKLVNEVGDCMPHDGVTLGNLLVKGCYVTAGYFKGEGGGVLDDDDFFDTGDIASIDTHGYMQIRDRAKDIIKSGGEWISSIEIENTAADHPSVELAAVIGMPHPRWDERPVLLIKLQAGMTASTEDILTHLEGKIAKWWIPDKVFFVHDIPLGATGKIDKRRLRAEAERWNFDISPAAICE